MDKLKQLEEDVPSVNNHQTIEEWEIEHGRGFWGNETTGYITNKEENGKD